MSNENMQAIYERIKILRKDYLKLSQEQFAKTINISRGNLSNIEINRVKVTDRVIADITSKFNVDRNWLEYGEGDSPFNVDFEEDEYTKYAAIIGEGQHDFIKNALIKYGKLSDENKKIIDEFLDSLIEK